MNFPEGLIPRGRQEVNHAHRDYTTSLTVAMT